MADKLKRKQSPQASIKTNLDNLKRYAILLNSLVVDIETELNEINETMDEVAWPIRLFYEEQIVTPIEEHEE